MTRALGKGAGICMRLLNSGFLRESAEIEVVEDPSQSQPRRLP